MAWAVHPFDLVRVDNPTHPDAVARSDTGAVLLAPPTDGEPWRWESVPHTDEWVSEEALQALNAVPWQLDGASGAGVKVAIFDVQWFGAEIVSAELGDVTTHDCWAHKSCMTPMDTLRPRFDFESGVHGTACAEVIHDIAPEAELHLVRVNNLTTLENAVAWAIREEIDLVSMSMSFFQESFYDGTGPLAVLMEDLERAGVLFVTSAGNYARGHWRGRYVDGDGDGRMDFDGENRLKLRYREGNTRGAYLAWDQYQSCGLTDLRAVLTNEAGDVLGRSDELQAFPTDEEEEEKKCEPLERLRISAYEDTWAWLEVHRVRGSTSGLDVDVMFPGGTIDGSMPEGSLVDPGTHSAVLTVGAVNATGYLTNDIEGFSSQGPTAGGLDKPDIAGPDGLSTASYGARGFFGTSAATPAVVGALALILSEDPSLTPYEAAERLKGWAWTEGDGFGPADPRWGSGKARLPVRSDSSSPCGQRPLLLPLLLLPLSWWRRRDARCDLA